MCSESVELWRRAESLFHRALEQPRPRRKDFVRRVGGTDQELIRAVNRLLEHDSDTESAAHTAARSPGLGSSLPADSWIGRQLGAYRLIRPIGRGGTASVYLACRADAEFEQRVAIKVLHRDSVDDRSQQRLRRERQILAGLVHPNIARLLDGGTAEDGIPYLAIEHVEGLPVTDYCDSTSLAVRQRLVLFRTICDAVAFAHRSLIVHRDLKPANILVSDEGVPKLLDFGIAKLLEGATLTSAGLTPAYASPEQRAGERVTTASDVYSLGILLYELLVGCRPEAPNAEGIFVRPSAAVQSAGEEARLRAAARSSTPEHLRRQLRGDLDSIVLRALRPEPEYRYPSVGSLARDIQSFLHGLPVSAGPDTRRYRLGKWIRRHRLALLSASLMAGMLLTFGMRLADERRRALAAQARAESVAETLVALFETADPYRSPDQPATQREALSRGAQRILHGWHGQPELRATLLGHLGSIYLRLGLHGKAHELLQASLDQWRRVFGDEHLKVAEALGALGSLSKEMGNYQEAEALLQQSLAMHRRLGKLDDPGSLRAVYRYASLQYETGDLEGAEAGYRQVMAAGLEDRSARLATGHLAMLLRRKAEFAPAAALLRQLVAVEQQRNGPEHPEVATLQGNLADVLFQLGQVGEAEQLYNDSLAIHRKTLGARHLVIAGDLEKLATLMARQGELAEAEDLYRQALDIRRERLGNGHGDVANTLNNLGNLLRELGELEPAEQMLQEAARIWKDQFGEEDPRLATTLNNLGLLLHDRGEIGAAQAHYQRAYEIRRRRLEPDHPDIANSLNNLATVLHDQGDPAAGSAYRQALEIQRRIYGADHLDLGISRNNFGRWLLDAQRFDQAVEQALEAERIFLESLPDGHWLPAYARSLRGAALTGLEQYDEAAALLEEAHETLQEAHGDDSRFTREARERLTDARRRR